MNRGSNRKFVSLGDLLKLKILMAPEPLQIDFAKKVKKISERKKEIQSQIATKQAKKKALIDEHF